MRLAKARAEQTKGKTSNNGTGKKNANNPYWDSACTVIPKFGAQPGIILFTIGDVMASHLLYAVKHTRQFEKTNLNPGQRIKMIDISQVRMRSKQGQFPDQNLVQVYYKALDAMYLVNMSIDNYLVIEETTKQIVNLHKNAVGSSRGHKNPDTHGLLEEIQKRSLGDFWRVLRTRPAINATKAKNPDVEYVPNNTYPYYLVKKTIDQKYPNIKVRPSRYWNETPEKDVADDVLYSLSEYWPGMPIDADIIRDNGELGLPVYRNLEARFGTPDPANNKAPIDAAATIQALVQSPIHLSNRWKIIF
jgi:hypothetical protein